MSQCYKFIDLFAGLGGVHKALEALGCECVFDSELKEYLRKLYQINFPSTQIEGDITKIDPKDIPAHEILCAGFPCQPFSQAGKRQGLMTKKIEEIFSITYVIYLILWPAVYSRKCRRR